VLFLPADLSVKVNSKCEIVARVLNQTISEYLTETVLSMLECELENRVSWELQKKLGRHVNEESGTAIAK